MAWGNLSWKFSFGEVCASFPGVPSEGMVGAPQLRCFLFTMWVLDSGCESPFSLYGDKGEGVAIFSTGTKGSFTELPARTYGLNVLVTHSCLLCISAALFSSVQGFSVDLDHVKHLLCCETKVFEVRFDPQSANLPLGEVDVLLPIKVPMACFLTPLCPCTSRGRWRVGDSNRCHWGSQLDTRSFPR